jgi:hypothetical protein
MTASLSRSSQRDSPCSPSPVSRALDAAFYGDVDQLWRFFLMPLLKVWVAFGALFSLTA